MVTTILTKTAIAVIALIIIFLITGRRIWHYKGYLALFLLLYFADNLLIVLTNRYPALQLIPNHVWEGFLVCVWSGKIYSILFTLSLLYITRRILSFTEIGLTLHQRKGSLLPSLVVILLLAGWAILVGIFSPKGSFDPIALVYLALMPGINEELVYRGYLLGILNKLMPVKINVLGATIGWGVVVTSILFSLLHGFGFENDLSIHIDMIALRNSFLSGLIFAWLRERTGSLLMPIVAHGIEDFFFFFPRMV